MAQVSVERLPIPRSLDRHAREWLSAGQPEGVPARAAATVMLLRDAESYSGIEVFMMRRVRTMAFAPAVWVFPGGAVDPLDAPAPGAEIAPDWARGTGLTVHEAATLSTAAAREVFEEVGVLLAEGTVPPADQLYADRARLEAHDVGFAQVLADHGLRLRADTLSLRDHWITPEFEPRRYDTWFFAAALPAGQDADDRSTENDQTGWVRPGDLLSQGARGQVSLMPPTIRQLEALALAADTDAYLATQPVVIPVMPVPEHDGDDIVLAAPRVAP